MSVRAALAIACLLSTLGAHAGAPTPTDAAVTPPPAADDIAPRPSGFVPGAPTPSRSAAESPRPGAAPRLTARLLQHVAAGKQPTTCAIADGGATLLVANRGDNSVSVFDTK